MAHTYTMANFAQIVGINKSTIRHYISILEDYGYQVERDGRNYRKFSDQDVAILQAYSSLHKNKGLTLKEAAEVVVAPNFNIQEVSITVANPVVIDRKEEIQRYEELSHAMELLAEHIHGVEVQNAQLIQLIQEERKQNVLLAEQNDSMKREFRQVVESLAPLTEKRQNDNRQMDRIEQQNSAIMAVLNKLNVWQHTQEIEQNEEDKKQRVQENGILSRFFGK
ncbi:MerR family transcriptional regulator [Rummeliibacillus stabekisii]|uniref:MerR family transcriptional regulator n=1 Tax=Rummeliibacillus stabekisii TaxID=241244 RepID=UPI001170FFFD|nr:MerR family transcriptional regulator [Rummeliibacillus stabekisii]MBB5168664.1 DNA-binding transcriptional MerR regulator [Rummeliibacillus stabekisii]GEL05198.1 hypothetical protein RST01_18250 [Rummeliibacillus stabekisii]